MDLVSRHRREFRTSRAAPGRSASWRRPVLWAMTAAGSLIIFYLAVITLAQDWDHARGQLEADLWFVTTITTGFGLQVGLFSYLRALRARSNPGAMAASTGTSTVAMLACCAHHVADALPVVGLSGAAVFLNDFKAPILWSGIGMNMLGTAYLVWKIRKLRSDVSGTRPAPLESRLRPGPAERS